MRQEYFLPIASKTKTATSRPYINCIMNDTTSFFDVPDAKGVAFCGDVHGEFDQLVHKCCVEYGMTDTLVVVAGD